MRQPKSVASVAQLRDALEQHRQRFVELQLKGLPFEQDLEMFRILQTTLECIEQSRAFLAKIRTGR